MRITVLIIALLLAGNSFSQSAEDRVELINELMTYYAENGLFSGTVLVAEHGEVIFESAYGYADREWMVPNTPDTRFRIASISKRFTMILVFQLYDEGIIDLNGTITDYIPEYSGPGGNEITVQQLLTHSSGIAGESAVQDLDDIERHSWTKEDLLHHIEGYELQFQPGEQNGYSNFGYFLLGVILERASGHSYAELLEERICEPAGMTATIPDQNSELIEHRASGYHYYPETGIINAPYLDMSFVFGYGHLLSTSHDLFLWDRALREGILVTPSLLEFMLFFDGYSENLGSNSVNVFRCGGSINGFRCSTHSYTQDERFIVVLSNLKDRNEEFIPSTFTVAGNIAAILYNVSYTLPDYPE